MFRKLIYTLSIIACLFTACQSKSTNHMNSNKLTIIIGTYTNGTSKGIYTFQFDQEKGVSTPLSETEITNPSYLVISEDNRFVYAVSEHNDGRESVSSFAFNPVKGTLTALNSQKAMGEDPCYISTNGKYVVTANYSGGSISIFPIDKDGSLLPASEVIHFTGSGPNKSRQEKPHLHFAQFTPDGNFLLANDLGTDRIYKFNVNTHTETISEKLFETEAPATFYVAAGSGPRHLTFSPNGDYAYLLNELSGTVIAFQYNNGQLTEIQSILADSIGAGGSADIHISPDGRFLYASNRLQADGLAIFAINSANGKLTKVGYQPTGIHPRNFNITPNGKYLLVACRDNNTIEVYKRDQESGLLTKTEADIAVSQPVCIQFSH